MRQCPIIQKYSTIPNIVHYEFCASTTHTTNQYRALYELADRLDQTTFMVNETPQGLGRGQGGGSRGDFRGGRTRGRGPRICYNCDEKGHMATQNKFQNRKIRYANEELTSSVQNQESY
jgi:hypothetical protein